MTQALYAHKKKKNRHLFLILLEAGEFRSSFEHFERAFVLHHIMAEVIT
jgi:hypothetical protein